MVEQTRTWPIGLRRLAEVIGPAAAVRLANVLGGVENVYIPKKARIDHEITAIIGLDRMEDLCAEFGGSQIEIPRGVFRDLKKTRIMDATGSNRDVALRLGCTQRYVREIRSQVRDDNQFNLFSEDT